MTLRNAIVFGMPVLAAFAFRPEWLVMAVGASMMWLLLDWVAGRE